MNKLIHNIYLLFKCNKIYKKINKDKSLKYLDRTKEYYEFKYDMEDQDNG